jgi:hypothetical protein
MVTGRSLRLTPNRRPVSPQHRYPRLGDRHPSHGPKTPRGLAGGDRCQPQPRYRHAAAARQSGALLLCTRACFEGAWPGMRVKLKKSAIQRRLNIGAYRALVHPSERACSRARVRARSRVFLTPELVVCSCACVCARVVRRPPVPSRSP